MSDFYVYILLDTRKEKGQYFYEGITITLDYPPFYVGKGKGKRVLEHLKYEADRNRHKSRIIQEIIERGMEYKYCIYKSNLSEDEAFSLEKELICYFGRRDLKKGELVNLTEGGEGSSGFVSKFLGKTYEESFGKERGDYLKSLRTGEKNGNFKNKSNGSKSLNDFCRDRKGKTYIDLYGEDKSDEIKKKIGEKSLGRKMKEESILKQKETIKLHGHYTKKEGYVSKQKGREVSLEQRKQIRETLLSSEFTKRGKSYEEYFGAERAKEVKKKQGQRVYKKNINYTIFNVYLNSDLIISFDKHDDFSSWLSKNKNKNFIIEKIKPNLLSKIGNI